jgi:hypothetical protein
MTADRDPSLDEIEIEIARTRARLTATCDALAAELTPLPLVEKGIGMLDGLLGRNRTIEFGGGVRADPVALALIGLGIAWFAAENAGLLEGFISERAAKAATSGKSIVVLPTNPPAAAGSASGSSNGWFHQAASATHGVFRSARDRGGAVIGRAGEFVTHRANSSDRVRQATSRIIGGPDRSPVVLALVGLAVGGAIALMVPATRRERQIATRVRDDLWDKAEELGHSAAASMREMAANPPHVSTDC